MRGDNAELRNEINRLKLAFDKLQSESEERDKGFQDQLDVKFLELSQSLYRAGDNQKENKIRQELFELGKTPVPPDEQITPLERDQLDFFQKSPGIGMVFLFVTFVISRVDLGASVLAAMGKDLSKGASKLEDGFTDHKDSKSNTKTGDGSHFPDLGDLDQDENEDQHEIPDDKDDKENEESKTDKGQAPTKRTPHLQEQKNEKEPGAIFGLVNRVWKGLKESRSSSAGRGTGV